MAKINLRRLEVFQHVYKHRSASKAAETLNITQPSVSRMLKDFELDVGVRLFELERGRLRPTPEADQLYQESTRVFEQVERAAQVADRLKDGQESLLRVAASSFLSFDILPEAAFIFNERYPHVQLDLHTKALVDQRASLLSGEVDIGIAVIPSPEAGITQMTLGRGSYVCLSPKEDFQDSAEVITMEQLKSELEILGPVDSPLMQKFLQKSSLNITGRKGVNVKSPILATRLAFISKKLVLTDLFTAVHSQPWQCIRGLEKEIEFDIQAHYLNLRPLSHLQKEFLEVFSQCLSAFMQKHNVY